MYKGKRVKKITHMSKRAALLVLSLTVILSLSVGGTLAYLIRGTESVVNVFEPGKVKTDITEDFADETDDVKNDVKITNTGNVEAYIRAKVVYTWVSESDKDEVVSGPLPVRDTHYHVEYNQEYWEQKGDYWYYRSPVAVGEATEQLLTNCYPIKDNVPVGARLQVTILTQAVQKEAYEANNNSWPTTDTKPAAT